MATRLSGACLALVLTACGGSGKTPPQNTLPPVAEEVPGDRDRPAAPPVAEAPRAPRTPKNVTLADVGLDPANLDRNADPCEDFYQFACGGWLAKNEIPANRSRHLSFTILRDRVQEIVRKILEASAKAPGDDPVKKKVGDYYAACMDEPAIERAGLKPVAPLLAKVKAVKDDATLAAAITELHKLDIHVVFGVGSGQDDKDATRVILILDQAGLGLPDRDYYLSDDAKFTEIRKQYEAHVARMLQLGGAAPATAKKQAAQVVAVETELARHQKSRVERRDPQTMYNKIDRPGVMQAAPTFPWDSYFAGVGAPDLKDINVTAPKYLEGFTAAMASLPKDAWKSYLTYHVLADTAGMLPRRFVAEQFKRRQLVSGQPKIEDRWERCVGATVGALGELVAKPFLAEHYGPESEKATTDMVNGIRTAMRASLSALPWMDAKTRQRAFVKLDKMAFQMGAPKKWKTYDFEVSRKTYAANALASRRFEFQRDLAKIGKPVDREEWRLPPSTVNAFYSANLNTMVFPAGILLPPFLNPKASTAVNLGAVGMVVGHELTHGFDDEGSQFDADGNLKTWWEASTRKEFDRRTKCVAEQYSAYEPIPGMKLNGELTLGENIADIGGLKLAFAAYRTLRASATEELVADGFTEDQQFFLGNAQVWCGKERPETLRQLITTDPHSPGRFRVNGAMQASPAFQKAFACKPGQGMVPAKRCDVW